jgi:tetratricopeptide (TPR) repeat protein
MSLRHRACLFTYATVLALSQLATSPLRAAETVARVPLTAVDYDTIWLTNGSSLVGTVVGTQPDGAVRFERPGNPTTLVPKNEMVRIDRHQSLAEAVSRRGEQALAAKDWLDLQRTLRFAAERPSTNDAGVKDAAIALAQRALAKKSSPEIAAIAIQLLSEKKDWDGVLGAAQAGLSADPNWTAGYEAQAGIFIERKQDERMKALVQVWLERQPTAFQANRYLARFAENAGDLRTAAEAYRKGFDLHQDWESALGYARCSLKRGEREESMRAAKTLIDKGQLVGPAKIWLASAVMMKVTTPEIAQQALTLLSAGLDDPQLDAETADVGRYNLGLLHEQAGRGDEARKLWMQVKGALGAVAMAHLEHRLIPTENLPTGLKSFVAEHNAAVHLENGTWQNVLADFDKTASNRAVFLGQIANLLKSAGADESVHNLAATASDESLRWQAYGLLKQARFAEAEALFDKLPITDGWVIACRVYLASARKDDAAARSWLKRLDHASNVPKKYASELLAEFASANDEMTTETFDDWPAGGPVATGWEVAALGTQITVLARNQALQFAGTQAGSDATTAYRLVLAKRLRSATVKLDLAEMKDSAIGGLELCDEKRENGLQLGASKGLVQWRAAEKGTWGPWTVTSLIAPGPEVGLRIELAKGVLYVALANDTTERKAVSASLGRSEHLTVGIFGVADPGTNWSLMADDLEIQLRPATRP